MKFGVVLLAVMMSVAAAAARAEEPPLQDPQLHIETGMHVSGIRRIAISADGQLLVTASDDKTARLWSMDDGRLLRTYRVPIASGSDGKIYAAAMTPDGRTVALGGWDAYYGANNGSHYIYLFETISGKPIQRLGPLPNVINELAFSADGKRLAAGLSRNNGIRVWQAPFTSEPFTDSDYGDSVYGLDFAPDGRLAATSDDGFLRLYDSSFKLTEKRPAPGGKWPFSIAFSPDGARLAVGHIDTMAIDILSGRLLKFLRSVDLTGYTNGDLMAVDWSRDGATLYAGGRNYDADGIYPIVAWKGKEGTRLLSPDGPRNTINDIVAAPQGGVVYSSHEPGFGRYDAAGKLVMWKGAVTADMRDKHSGRFLAAPDAMSVWFGLKPGAAEPWLFDLNRLAFMAAEKAPEGFIAPVTEGLAVEGWINQMQPTLAKQVLELETYETARSLAVAPDKQSFVLGSDWAINRFDAGGKRLWRKSVEGAGWGVNLSADGEVAVVALGDGTIRWYRTSDATELLAFFVHVPDKKWIAWTPAGYYAASPGGEDLIGWHVNGKTWDERPEFFPASRFRDRFYRPDIVQLVLKTRDEAEATETANAKTGVEPPEQETIQELLPAVVEFAEDTLELETSTRDIELRYRVRSPSGRPITRLEIQIDGRPVTPRGVAAVDDADDANVLALSVPPRDSQITLIAYIGDQPGVPVTLPVKWTGPIVVDKKPNLYALLIGVSDYSDAQLKLGYAAKDARDLSEKLAAQNGVFYNGVDIKLLLDGDATENAIETELARLRKKAGPDDNVIVFMAGHGVTDDARDFYFLPTGADTAPDMLAATAIDGDIIRKGLAKIPGKVILFMDACHAGAGIQGGISQVDMSGLANGLTDGASVVMFASSTGREVSFEGPQWENGAFTEALLAIFDDRSAYGADGKLSISELDEQLTTRVEELTEGKQTPVMTKPGAIKRFFLASL
jgi:WD40 repeat protein